MEMRRLKLLVVGDHEEVIIELKVLGYCPQTFNCDVMAEWLGLWAHVLGILGISLRSYCCLATEVLHT